MTDLGKLIGLTLTLAAFVGLIAGAVRLWDHLEHRVAVVEWLRKYDHGNAPWEGMP